jgi:hypothetical protein
LAFMSDREKWDLRGLRSIYIVNMAGYKSAPGDIIRIVLNLYNVILFFGGGGGLIYISAVS